MTLPSPYCSAFPIRRKASGSVQTSNEGRCAVIVRRKADDRQQRTEDRRQRTEDRRQRTEDRGPTHQITENLFGTGQANKGRQKTALRQAHGKGQKSEGRGRMEYFLIDSSTSVLRSRLAMDK